MTLVTPRIAAPTTSPVSGTKPDPRQAATNDSAAQSTAPAEGSAQEDNLSRNIAALARREKEQRRQAEELKKQRESWEAERAAEKARWEAELKDKYIPKDRLLSDPWATLEDTGLDYDKLTNLKLAQGSPELQYIQKLEKKLAELESKTTQVDKRFEEQQTQQYQQALKQIGADVTALVESSDEFEGIKATNSQQDVVDEIERVFKEEGRLMTIEEAAKKIENYIIEESYKLAQLNKVKSKLAPPVTEDAPQQTAQPQKTQTGIKTLTNAVTTAQSKPLSPSDKRARAIAAFEGRLK